MLGAFRRGSLQIQPQKEQRLRFKEIHIVLEIIASKYQVNKQVKMKLDSFIDKKIDEFWQNCNNPNNDRLKC